MAETVAQMTPSELQDLIEEAVERKMFEIFGDPDAGLELREEVRERLIRQQREVAAGKLGRPLDEVARELGWE
jgi:hypothetical protein